MSIYPAWVTVLKHPPYFMSLNPHSTRVIMPIAEEETEAQRTLKLVQVYTAKKGAGQGLNEGVGL